MSGNSQLPNGWTLFQLRDLLDGRGKSLDPRAFPSEQYDLYSVPSFESGEPERVLGGSVGSAKQIVEPGTVLLCRINPRINRVWVVSSAVGLRQLASTEWVPIPRRSGVDPFYLAYYLTQDWVRNYLAANVSGVGGSLMRARLEAVADLEVRLAPLLEQQRIVAEIEKQFTRLDAAVASLQRARANLKRYRASVLKAACEGRLVPTEAELARREGRTYEPASVLLERILRERRARWEAKPGRKGKYKELQAPDASDLPPLPEGWVWASLAQLCEVGTGSTPLTTRRAYYEGGSIPWITSAAVGSLQVRAAEKFVTETAVREHRLKLYPVETLILAMYGEGHNRGKVAELLISATINQALAGLVFEAATIACRVYAKWFLVSRYEQTRRASSGGVQPNLNLGIVAAIPVPLPPLAEQQRIVAQVERHLSVIQAGENVVEANLKRAERLRQAILQRAFQGKLAPQDPGDEPASVLLERIRVERENSDIDRGATRRRNGRHIKSQEISA